MSTAGNRTVIAIARRIVFSCLIIAAVWLLLLLLRHAIPVGIYDYRIGDAGVWNNWPTAKISAEIAKWHNPITWDWTQSLINRAPVSEVIKPQLGITFSLIGLAAGFSLLITTAFLFVTVFLRRLSSRHTRLASASKVAQIIFTSISSGFFIWAMGSLSLVMLFLYNHFGFLWWDGANSFAAQIWTALAISLIPAGLLIQAAQSYTGKWPENTPFRKLLRDIGILSVIRLLRLVGLLISILILLQIGIGSPIINSMKQQDYPVFFGIVWVIVVIFVVCRLAADITEITCKSPIKQGLSSEQELKETPRRLAIPKSLIIFSLALVGLIVVIAVVGPIFAPHSVFDVNSNNVLLPPSLKYLMGTDNLGRDTFSRILYGVRIDVLLGLAGAVIVSVIAAAWLLLINNTNRLDNWVGDTIRDIVLLHVDIIISFPWLVLLLLLLSVFGNDSVLVVIYIFALVLLPRVAGVIQELFRSTPAGINRRRRFFMITSVALLFTTAGIIIFLATISYLGYGIHPPYPELGFMLSRSTYIYTYISPWIILWPGVILVAVVFAFILAGNTLLEKFGFKSTAVWGKMLE